MQEFLFGFIFYEGPAENLLLSFALESFSFIQNALVLANV